MESKLKLDIIEISNGTTEIIFDDAHDESANNDYKYLKDLYPDSNVASVYYDNLIKLAKEWKLITEDKTVSWSHLTECEIFKRVAANTLEEIENNKAEQKFLDQEEKEMNPGNEDFKPTGVLPYESISRHSVIGDLHIDDDLFEAKRAGKRALVYDAFTGAGKSLSMDKWVATRSLEMHSGIILTHTNAEAWKHYNNIITWNSAYIGHIFVFNSDNESEYKRVLRNPEILNQYNWVICFQSRLLSSDVDVLFTCLKNLDDRRRLRSDTRTYILSDECIPSADEQVLKKSDIVKIDNASNYALSDYIRNPNSYESRDKLKRYFRELEDRVYSLTDAKDLLHDDAVVLSAFNSKRDVRNSSIYQLKVYMARFSTLLNFMFNRYEEFIEKYNVNYIDSTKEVLIKYYPKIDEIGIGHDLVIFDATARINYGVDNPYFHIKTIAKLPSNVLDFNILDISFPKRDGLSKAQFDKFFDDLYESGFKFKDNSIIIWNMCPWFTDTNTNPDAAEIYKRDSTKRYSVVKLKEFIRRTGSQGCLVTFFNGGEIKGENRFSSCTNVYILSNYKIDYEALYQARNAMMNNKYWNQHKFLGDIIQCIGRGAVRNRRTSIPDNQPGVMNIYFSKDVDPAHIVALAEYYEVKSNRFKYKTEAEFNRWVDVMLANASTAVGPSLKFDNSRDSGFIDKRGKNTLTINAIKYLSKLAYDGIDNVHVKELGKELGVKEPKLSKFEVAIRALNYLGLRMKIYSKYDSIMTTAYQSAESLSAN